MSPVWLEGNKSVGAHQWEYSTYWVCVCSFLLSDWFQLQIQSVQLRDGLVSSNHRSAFYLNCSQHCLWALGNKDREDSVNVASACLPVVLHCVNMLKMLMQRLTQQGETLPPLIDQKTRQTAISCLWLWLISGWCLRCDGIAADNTSSDYISSVVDKLKHQQLC